MHVRISPEGTVDFPQEVLDTLGVGPGDRLNVELSERGYVLSPSRIDHSRLGTLRDKISPDAKPFDIAKFRARAYDPRLRD